MSKYYVRQHCSEEVADGRDEGGFYRMVETKPVDSKIQNRMKKCSGCHDNFYNGRVNFSGNHCWSLNDADNFKGNSRPKCHH